MTPDFPLRLQVMQRAMLDSVLPAIPAEDQLAREQANLIVGYLAIMADQCERLLDYELIELKDHRNLIHDLLRVAEGGSQTAEAAREARRVAEAVGPLADLPIPPQTEIVAQGQAAKAAASALIAAAEVDGTANFRQALGRIVLHYAGPQILRWRGWIAKAGFDPAPDSLPQLECTLTPPIGPEPTP